MSIDLASLPLPQIVEELDYETIYQSMLAEFRVLMGDGWTAVLESDPVVKLLETAAYREMLLRARINDAARAVMPAFAIGTDLDQIAARENVERLLVAPADPQAVPPTEDIWESDERLRSRYQMALEARTTAGPSGMYEFLALSASARVLDVNVVGPALIWTDGVPTSSNGIPPGMVMIYLLSTDNGGVPDSTLLGTVYNAISADTVRPLCDSVTVAAATVNSYVIQAVLYVYPGPSWGDVLAAAELAAQAYADRMFKIGYNIQLSAVYAALHVDGVERVELAHPSSDIVNAFNQVSKCTAISISIGGVDE